MHALVTLQGDAPGCLQLSGGYYPLSGGDLGKFKLKIKGPKIKVKAPKIKAPKIKLKIKGPNLSKAVKNLWSPFEKIGGSLTNIGTGLLDSVAQAAPGIVQSVGQAVQDKAGGLLDAGLNMLAPGSGMLSSLTDMLPGGVGDMLSSVTSNLSPGRDRVSDFLQPSADGIFRPAPAADLFSPTQMITLTTFGETPRVSQWLGAVRPNSTEILFSDRTQTRVQTTYSDDTHAASAVAAAVVAGVTVEKQEQAPVPTPPPVPVDAGTDKTLVYGGIAAGLVLVLVMMNRGKK